MNTQEQEIQATEGGIQKENFFVKTEKMLDRWIGKAVQREEVSWKDGWPIKYSLAEALKNNLNNKQKDEY